MNRFWVVWSIPFLVGLAVPARSVAAQTDLRGLVRDSAGVPVAGVTVALTNIGYAVKTDSLGRFQFSGTPGSTLSLTLQATGFREEKVDVVLPRGRAVARDFVLVSEATPLPEVNPSDRVLRGRVTDTDGAPLSFVNVQLNGGTRIVADDSGRFTIPRAGSGRIWLLARRIGFDPAELRLGTMPDTAVRITMTPLATVLPAMRVTGRAAVVSLDLHGFYDRMRDVDRGINRGYFVTPEELELRRPINLTAAVQYAPFVRIRPIPGVQLPGWQDMRIEDTQHCPLTVYMDRIRIQPTRERGRVKDERVNLLALPTHLGGIEIYPRYFGAPPAYPAVDGTCGVVLVWTK